jgi:hypothetical protein
MATRASSPPSSSTGASSPPSLSTPRRPRFPLDDLAYDLIAILHAKSKGLEAHEKYGRDARRDPQLIVLLEQIREDDEAHVQALQEHLCRLLSERTAAATAEVLLPRTAESAGALENEAEEYEEEEEDEEEESEEEEDE